MLVDNFHVGSGFEVEPIRWGAPNEPLDRGRVPFDGSSRVVKCPLASVVLRHNRDRPRPVKINSGLIDLYPILGSVGLPREPINHTSVIDSSPCSLVGAESDLHQEREGPTVLI